MKKNNKIFILCRVGVLAAIYVVLSLLSIKIGNLHITLKFLPLAISAMLFRPFESMIVAVLGEFICQLCSEYGLSQTTVLWIIAPAVYAGVLGCFVKYFGNGSRPIEQRPVIAMAACIISALLATVTNTVMMYVDSKIWGYYTKALIFGQLSVRILTGVIAAVVICIASCEVTRLIKKANIL